MTITVEATFENGVLTPKHPISLSEGEVVRLVITPADRAATAADNGTGAGFADASPAGSAISDDD